MNIAKFIPSWVFAICILANALLAGSSILMGLPDLFALNALSGVSCYIGYRLSKKAEEESE